jgi:hypothetical protein
LATPKEAAAIPSGSFVDETPEKPEALKIESAGKPLAFGNLMEPSGSQSPEDSGFLAPPPNPELADRDWSAAEDEDDEEEEEDSASSSWRRDGGSEEIAAEPAGETASEKAARAKRRESWTPTREKAQDLLEEAVAPESFSPAVAPPAPVPSGFSEAVPPQRSYVVPSAPGPELLESKTILETQVASEPEVAPVIESAPEPSVQEPAKPNGANSWFSTSSSPWEAEAQKANKLASNWDAPAAPSASVVSEPIVEEAQPVEEAHAEAPVSYDFVSEAPSEEPVSYVPDPGLVGNEVVAHTRLPELISDGSISPETVENIRQETSSALESVSQSVVEKPAEASAKTPDSSQPDMDLLVANVLAKMSPEMLQAVTREILKPVVAAMIRDEIKAKKS